MVDVEIHIAIREHTRNDWNDVQDGYANATFNLKINTKLDCYIDYTCSISTLYLLIII